MRSLNTDFYVYEYVRLDTFEPCYIGKGRGNRWRSFSQRGSHIKRIKEKVGIAVIILHDNLTEQQALEYECWYIYKLRDIEGYDLVNKTDGGEGTSGYKHTEKSKSKMKTNHWALGNKPEDNPFYGKTHNENAKNKISLANKGRKAKPGDKNARPVYAIKDNEVINFISVKELSKWFEKHERTIFRYLKSGKELHGYTLKYMEAVNNV